jgi:alpha-L-arabinofuranosidase
MKTMQMHKTLILLVVLLWQVFGGCSAKAGDALLTIRLNQPSNRISPVLHGIFLEEANYSIDGGLYGELLRNRSFEDAVALVGWEPVESAPGRLTISLDATQSLHPANFKSLKLEISPGAPGRTGMANTGYWGIQVNAGQEYDFLVWSKRNETFTGGLTVSLEDAQGKVLAEAKVEGLLPQWKRLSCRLKAKESSAQGRLVICVNGSGTIWLDQASLMAINTGAFSGLRMDLAQRIAALKPSFVRFPGGRVVNGDQPGQGYRWKPTLGEAEGRPGHLTGDRFWATDGFGFHEFLQFCDQLGAQPWWVTSCGLTTGGAVERSGRWLDDALDALAYAHGAVTNEWGRMRSQHGHPEPFGLPYIELGSDSGGFVYAMKRLYPAEAYGGVVYEPTFARGQKAIHERFPQARVIANGFLRDTQPDLVNERVHGGPEWLISSAHRYDGYDRKGPSVCISEFGCDEECGQGNLRAALAEAVFLTGVERNADVVVMAAQGPLLGHAKVRMETPPSIRFNGAIHWVTPSYYVQQMFSHNRGDVNLAVQLGTAKAMPQARGGIGLGTWKTEVEFSDIVVSQGERVLYQSQFSQGASEWKPQHGNWLVQNGNYRQTLIDEYLYTLCGDTHWTDYTLRLRARKLKGDEGFLIRFRVREDGSCYWWNLGGWRNQWHAVEKTVGGIWPYIGTWPKLISEPVDGHIEPNRWYDIRIEVEGARVRCYLDGQLVHDCIDPAMAPLTAIASRLEKTSEVILKVVNVSETDHTTQVHLEGAASVDPDGTAVVLTSGRWDDENTLAQPNKVTPAVRELRDLSTTFSHTFPARSLTILRLEAH